MGIFSKFSEANPAEIALDFIGQNPERLTFAELRSRSLKYAANSRPGLNLIIMRSSPNAMAAFLGCIAVGNQPAMLSHPDGREIPLDYKNKINKICEQVKPSAIFTDPEFNALIGSLVNCTVITSAGNNEATICESNENAFIQFSSGTTGLQKGVPISHEAILAHNAAYIPIINMDKTSKIFSWLPLYHDMGLISCFLMPLMNGTPVVFMSPFEWLARPASMLDAIQKHQCTHCWMPNFAFKLMSDRIKIGEWDLSSIRQIINCSEPCYPSTMQAFFDRFKSSKLAEHSISTCYAMAENVFAMAHGIGKDFSPVSRLVPSVKAKIAEDGEIWIKSPFSFNGYYLQNQEYLDIDGFYPTGDLGDINGDLIKINGRKKDLIKVEGRNIYPNDIEQIIGEVAGVYPGRYVALGEFNERKGTEEILIICERKDGDPEDIKKNIMTMLSQKLHLVADVIVTPHGWLRKTSSGKISRSANLNKIKEHRKRIRKGLDIVEKICKDAGKEVIITPDMNLIKTGVLSSIDMFTTVLELEVALKIGLGGAYSIYGEHNTSIKDLVFFAEMKFYGNNK